MLTVEYEGLLDYIEKPFIWVGKKISSLFHSSPVHSTPSINPSVNSGINTSLEKAFAKYVRMPNLVQSQSTSLRDTFAKYVNLSNLSKLPNTTTTNTPIISANSSSLSSSFLNTVKDILAQTGKVIISTATQAAANALSYKIQKALGVPVVVSGNSIHVYHPIQPQPQLQPRYTPRPQPQSQPRYTYRPQAGYTPRPQAQQQPRYTPRPQPQLKANANTNTQINKNLLILGGVLLLAFALSRR